MSKYNSNNRDRSGKGTSSYSRVGGSRYHPTSRTIMAGFSDQVRSPPKSTTSTQQQSVDFLKSLVADKSKVKKPTHAELRTMAIQEKKISIQVKQERARAKEERARRMALVQAEQNVLQAQLEIDDYKNKYRRHEIFVFEPMSLAACHEHVKEMEQLWRNDVLTQMKLHRQSPSTFQRIHHLSVKRSAAGARMEKQNSSSSVESAEMVACIAQVLTKHQVVREAVRAIKSLIQRGADVNCHAESDSTAVVRDGEATISDGHTPLMLASLVDDIELCTELVNQKADLTYVCSLDGLTALTVAIINRKHSIVRLLCEAATAQGVVDAVVNPATRSWDRGNAAGDASLIPLECAINLNEPEMVSVLVNNGACMTRSESALLVQAICMGSYEITKLLLEAGCPLSDKIDACHMGEASIAALSGRFDILQLLFEHHPQLLVEEAEHLNEEAVGEHATPTAETSIFRPHEIVRQVFAFEIEDAVFYAGAVNRIVHRHQADIATMPPAGMTAEEQARLDDDSDDEDHSSHRSGHSPSHHPHPHHQRRPGGGQEQRNSPKGRRRRREHVAGSGVDAVRGAGRSVGHGSKSPMRKFASMRKKSFLRKPTMGGISAEGHHDMAKERSAYNSFVEHELQVEDVFAHWLTRQTFYGGRQPPQWTNSEMDDDNDVDVVPVDAENALEEDLLGSSADVASTAQAARESDRPQRSSERSNSSHKSATGTAAALPPQQPQGEQEHFLLQRYDKYFDDVVQLLLFQLRLECEVHHMVEMFHGHPEAARQRQRQRRVAFQQGGGLDGGSQQQQQQQLPNEGPGIARESWSTTDVEPQPFGRWYRKYFMLFSKIVQRFGRPLAEAFGHQSVAQIVRSVASRYVREAPRDDDGDGKVDEPDELDQAAEEAARKVAAISKHQEHATQEKLLMAVARDDHVEAMIQVLGFEAPPSLTIGTVFSASTYFNAAADATTQELIRTSGMTSMLLYAVHRRAPHVVEALLLLKADANAADTQGITPLMLAAHLNDSTGTKMVRDILRHAGGSVDPFATTAMDVVCGGVSAFYIAAQQGHLQTLQTMVETTRVNIVAGGLHASTQGSPRHSLFVRPDDDPLKAHLNTPILDSSTPLLVAVYFGHIDIVKFLLAEGCSVNLEEDDSDSDGDESVGTLSPTSTGALSPHNGGGASNAVADTRSTLVSFNAVEAAKPPAQALAVRRGHLDVARVLMMAGASLDATYGPHVLLGGQQVSLVMMAVFHGDMTSLRTLIELGADVSWTPRADGFNAAHFAALMFDLEILNFLNDHPKVRVNESLQRRTAAGEDCNGLMKRWYQVKLKHALRIDPHMLVTRNAKALRHDAQKAWATHCPTGRLASVDDMHGIIASMDINLHFPMDAELDLFANAVLCRADADRDGIIGIKQFSGVFEHLSKIEALYEYLVKNHLLEADDN